MTTRSLFLCLSFLLVSHSAPADGQEAPKTLQGTWTIVASFDLDGKRVPIKDGQKGPPFGSGTIVFEAARGVFKDLHGKGRHQEFTFTVDSAPKPKQIDFKDAPTGKDLWLGIYQTDGDTLKLCFGKTSKGRPTEFKHPAGQDRGAAFELKREKAK